MPDDANLGVTGEKQLEPLPYHLLVVCNKDIDHALILPFTGTSACTATHLPNSSGVQLTTHERRAFAHSHNSEVLPVGGRASVPESIDHPYPHRTGFSTQTHLGLATRRMAKDVRQRSCTMR